ncbi:MAG: hypothetical protein IBX60_07685 [Candidatus Aminicenantes bacterium]|nr:hypothetical protein [Candidatus Aminicenantes bacterium]
MDKNEYKELFEKLIRKKHGMETNFEKIEGKLDHLRKGNSLAYSDLGIIGDDSCWPFSKYWMWPSKEQIEEELKKTSGWFVNLPENEERIIGGLDGIFKNIAIVSIILRFVYPEFYAIYSRPPLKILRIERGTNDIEEYLNYVNIMRLLKHSFGVTRTAGIDMIVWAIAYEKGSYLRKLKELLADQLPENLEPKELITYLSDNPLKIAEVYYQKKDIKTAGFWAAVAFEQFIGNEYLSLYGFPLENEKDRIFTIVNFLCITKKFKYECDNLHKLREFRNNAVHELRKFTEDDARCFIKKLKYLKELG